MNDKKFVKAEYKEQKVTQYQGNPLIEALPEIMTKEEILEELIHHPKYSSTEVEFEDETRVYSVDKLFEYFQPLPMHITYAEKIGKLIRNGYISRNPKVYNPLIKLSKIEQDNLDIGDSSSSVKSSAFVGVSGVGKTVSTNRILKLYDQVIIHDRPYNIYQVVWLKIDCPYDGSLKQLCMSFFSEMDNVLGTNYFEKHGKSRKSIDEMMTMMKKVAAIHQLGLLIIDEIQHLDLAKSGGSEKMLNFFVTLNNTIGVPVLLIGTPKARKLFQGDLRQARRMDGLGAISWERLVNDEYWDFLINEIWDYNWLKKQPELNDEIINILYHESQGIIDAVIKIYILAQCRAINDGSETITTDLIKLVARQDLVNMRPMLEALKSGDLSEIAKYGDIMPVNFDDIRQKVLKPSRQFLLKKTELEEQESIIYEKAAQVIAKLMGKKIRYEVAEELTDKILKKEPSLSVDKVYERIIKKFEKKNNNSYDGKKEDRVLGSLHSQAKECGVPVSSILEENGYIKDPMEVY